MDPSAVPVPVIKNHRITESTTFHRHGFGQGKNLEDRNAIANDLQKWPNGVIPFEFHDSIGEKADEIIVAMNHISEHTCVKFIPRTEEEDFIQITYGAFSGCHSHWGRVGGLQKVNLGAGCYDFGTLLHELMHAIGFDHEHNRSDRDDYVDILWENIEEIYHDQFKKLSPEENRLLTPFDYDSIMMYGSRSFATDEDLFTMLAKDGTVLKEVYEKEGLSDSDIKRINILYDCDSDK